MPSERTFWWCGGRNGNGHVVGELAYVYLREGGRVTALLVYEQSMSAPPAEIPPLRQRLVGLALDTRCTCCGRGFDWYPGEAALEKLLSRYRKEVVG